MNIRPYPAIIVAALFVALTLCSAPAHAFRCGNKIVTEDMHEARVRAACGTPTTMRTIGRAVRNINVPIERVHGGGWSQQYFPGYGFAQEVIITEYVYNFGPRKLMRRLLFEGGILVSIETLGYGYKEEKQDD
jgi:hypothetical protein